MREAGQEQRRAAGVCLTFIPRPSGPRPWPCPPIPCCVYRQPPSPNPRTTTLPNIHRCCGPDPSWGGWSPPPTRPSPFAPEAATLSLLSEARAAGRGVRGGLPGAAPAPAPPHCTLWGCSPAAVVVAAHEDFAAPAADGAVGLVAIVIILVGAFQEAVLQEELGGVRGVQTLSPREGGQFPLPLSLLLGQ